MRTKIITLTITITTDELQFAVQIRRPEHACGACSRFFASALRQACDGARSSSPER
jgi:hypothetical protein